MAIIKKFSVSSRRAKEGNWVDVSWECGTPDAVYLSTDNGYKTDRISLADTGSTRVYISKSKGSTKVTLMAVLGAAKESKTETIHVTNVKTIKAKPAGIDKFQLWKEKMHARWCQFSAQIKCWWQYLPKKKKTIYKVLFFLWLALLAASIIVPSEKEHHSETAPTEQVLMLDCLQGIDFAETILRRSLGSPDTTDGTRRMSFPTWERIFTADQETNALFTSIWKTTRFMIHAALL